MNKGMESFDEDSLAKILIIRHPFPSYQIKHDCGSPKEKYYKIIFFS